MKSDQILIYVTEETYYGLLSAQTEVFLGTSVGYNYITYNYANNLASDDLMYGALPTSDDQVIVSSSLLEVMGLNAWLDDATSWPQTNTYLGEVAGVYEATTFMMWTGASDLQEAAYASKANNYSISLYIHTNDHKTLINNLNNIDTVVGYTETQYAIAQAQLSVSLGFMVPMIVIIFSASFLGFYFLMHSTMISRIYEISVYRSLGMKKKELLVSHIVEASFMTTITSIVGYLVASFLLLQIGTSALGYSPFIISPLSILLGIILVYVINVGAGIIPITTLLRKTPSEISSKYDI